MISRHSLVGNIKLYPIYIIYIYILLMLPFGLVTEKLSRTQLWHNCRNQHVCCRCRRVASPKVWEGRRDQETARDEERGPTWTNCSTKLQQDQWVVGSRFNALLERTCVFFLLLRTRGSWKVTLPPTGQWLHQKWGAAGQLFKCVNRKLGKTS